MSLVFVSYVFKLLKSKFHPILLNMSSKPFVAKNWMLSYALAGNSTAFQSALQYQWELPLDGSLHNPLHLKD